MSLPSALAGLTEVLGASTADVRGKLAKGTGAAISDAAAAASASALSEIAVAGSAVGFSHLETLLVKGASKATMTAIRGEELLLVAVDPAKSTAQVEKVLQAWASNGAAARTPAPPSSAKPTQSRNPLTSELRTVTPPALTPAAGTPAAGSPASSSPALPRGAVVTSPAGSAQSEVPPGASADAWAGLRRALVRGLLTEASSRRREIGEKAPVAGTVGAEPIAPAELDRVMQVLVQGIGSVLAGDGVAGARMLEALVGVAQPNLSLGWLALIWSGRAALKSGNSGAARGHVKQALAVAKQLDREAMAVSQWIAAELLAHDADHARALQYLEQARTTFQKLGDRWGLGQTALAEARVLVALGREQEAVAAARQAWSADRAWEDPAVFLARRALVRNDLTEAEGILRYISGPSAERLRSLMEAMRQSVVTPADASEFLKESEAPPTARSIRAMERIAQAAPRFLQAREALAWMLLKIGKYAEASTLFRGLLGQQITQADRASIMLGLGCIAHAQQNGKNPDARLHAAVTAGGAKGPGANGASDVAPLLPLSVSSIGRSSQVATGGSVFSGQLSVFALPDVVEFVRSARRTGLLVCSSEKGMAAVRFREGRITGATSPGTPDLGEILVRARKISSVALRAARSGQAGDQPDHVLGEQLVKDGLVEAPAVQEALRRRVELTFLELVQWKDGEFAFNREGENEQASTNVPIDLDAQDVLLNVFKQMDEDARSRTAPGVQR